MKKWIGVKILIAIISMWIVGSCSNPSNQKSTMIVESNEFQNQGHKLVFEMVKKVGTLNDIRDKKDVSYTYTYETPDGKSDISKEKYLFEGELSYGRYIKHERTLPQLEGVIEQGYDGQEFWLKHNGKTLNDKDLLDRVAFNRPTNYYWFTMMQKMVDPGLIYEYLGQTTLDEKIYDIVKISFEADNDKPTDIYQLYINKETQLVDQFLFTVADFGKIEVPNLMQLEYETIDGIVIPTKRQYKESTWNAEVSEGPWIKVNWSEIRFNNNLSKEDFRK